MNNKKLYTLAFVEGAFVITIEIIGGKMLSAVYGSSLYIWTSIIGITLLSLTIGYFLGGFLTLKNNLKNKLNLLFLLSTIFVLLMPFFADVLTATFLNQNLFVGCIFMSLALLGIPLIFLGATSPIIIQLCTSELKSSGKIAGRFYAISTVGGIVNTFLLGFFLIPTFGIRVPLLVWCIVVLLTTLLIPEIKNKLRIVFFLIFISITIFFYFVLEAKKDKIFKEVYKSEGIMGQLKVVDYIGEKGYINRALLTNNSAQSIVTKTNVTVISQYNYVHFISSIATLKPKQSNVLLLGMAGGSLVYELQKQGFTIDVVDIDERMFYIAEHYFYLQKINTNLFTDDARHFIKTAKKKYDMVIIDISSSETQPSYLYTQECFSEVKNILQNDGLFFVNFQGVVEGKSDLAIATWSVFKTLQAVDFKTYYFSFSKNITDDIQFVASKKSIDFSKLDSTNFNLCCTQNIHIQKIMRTKSLSSSMNACEVAPLVFTDDKPLLEKLKYETVINARKEIRNQINGKQQKLSSRK